MLATLEADLPARVSDRGFLPLFNATLILAGLLSVIGIAVASAIVADRLTRPVRDVTDAARRLGAGDPDARATGGGDRESAELATAFNTMADRLGRSEMLRRRAASDVAHDLATPATVLESQLQAMVDGVVPADRENLEAARSAASALGSVVAELNDLASAEAAPLQAQPVARRPVRRGPRRRDGARRAAPRAGGRPRGGGPGGAARDGRPGPPLAGPPQRHRQRDRAQPGRRSRGGVGRGARGGPGAPATAPATVAIRVADEGPGIAPDDVPHVFERFYRADPARAVDPATGRRTGSGLGLTIARELLAANGGRIEVESTGPTGTTFRIDLPRG